MTVFPPEWQLASKMPKVPLHRPGIQYRWVYLSVAGEGEGEGEGGEAGGL